MRTNKHFYGERAFWVKGVEAKLIRARELTVIIRPGDRSDRVVAPQQWLPLNEPIPVYYISVPGDQAKNIPAQFVPDDGTTVRVVGKIVKRLKDINYGDLEFSRTGYEGTGAVPKLQHAASMSDAFGDERWTENAIRAYLGDELVPGKSFSSDDFMTLYLIEYLTYEDPATD